MKRFLILGLLTIGLSFLSVASAKGHEPVIVSIDDGSSAGYIFLIHSGMVYSYVAEVTNERIMPYVDELVKPTLDGYGDEVFHPPVNRNQHI